MDLSTRQTGGGRCGHVSPVVAEPAPEGRVARCLVCGQSGPVRRSSERALAALREEPGGYLGGGFPQRISYLRVLPPGPKPVSLPD